MDIADILAAQLLDPFRIGLVVMLLFTAARTRDNLGNWVPLALGVVFIAVLIPTTLGGDEGDKPLRIALGLVSNAVILAIALAAKAAFGVLTRRS